MGSTQQKEGQITLTYLRKSHWITRSTDTHTTAAAEEEQTGK